MIQRASHDPVSQRELERAVTLRRHARDASHEAYKHNLDLAARLLADEQTEQGRYRVRLNRVSLAGHEETYLMGIFDREMGDPDPDPVLVVAFRAAELDTLDA